jgi:hypothetical protein
MHFCSPSALYTNTVPGSPVCWGLEFESHQYPRPRKMGSIHSCCLDLFARGKLVGALGWPLPRLVSLKCLGLYIDARIRRNWLMLRHRSNFNVCMIWPILPSNNKFANVCTWSTQSFDLLLDVAKAPVICLLIHWFKECSSFKFRNWPLRIWHPMFSVN